MANITSSDRDKSCYPQEFSDPDVTGIGVLISFGISNLFTIIAILIAYICRALRRDRYNALDDVLLGGIWRLIPGKRDPTHGHVIARQRIDAFETFIQAMADQQLFTGMALIVAIYIIRYTGFDANISAYSFVIAVNLALLSCVIHLSAMTVLRTHLSKLKRLRDVRVFIMVAAIALLIPQLVASNLLTDPEVTLRCALDDYDGSPLLIWYSSDVSAQTNFFAALSITGFLVFGYSRRLLELYFPVFTASTEDCAAEILYRLTGWPDHEDRARFKVVALDDQVSIASRFMIRDIDRTWFAVAAVLGRGLREVLWQLMGSFFFEITWLIFYTTYGMANLLFYFEAGPSKKVSFVMSFGQILPLVLLGLPFLSAFDLYLGLKKEKQLSAKNGIMQPAAHLNNVPRQVVVSPHPLKNAGDKDYIYKMYMDRHYKFTIICTWVVVVGYAALVFFGAVVFTGILWMYAEAEDQTSLMMMGYWMTMLYFIVTIGSFLITTLGAISWIWTRRYRRSFTPHSELDPDVYGYPHPELD
ncbi:hypothetical protein B0H63DRAFT_472562 [Podospora didyma]|uniref:Uncharacterized protein n=1 Tax=Podospora didyma TaxID=330526 RepID=A0AAE0TZH7_9PEZI|nr:hypothetical protein B0H63DRAFT_472562 [Podospora didyma]